MDDELHRRLHRRDPRQPVHGAPDVHLDNQSDKSAGGDPSGDIDAGGFANADTYDRYVEYYNWLLGQKANEDAELQAQVEEYAAQGIQPPLWRTRSPSGRCCCFQRVRRQTFFAYHSDRKVISDDEPGGGDNPPPPAGDGDITFRKVIAGTDQGPGRGRV